MSSSKTEALGNQIIGILQEAAGAGGNSEAITKAGMRIAEIFTAVTADLEKRVARQQATIDSTKKTLVRLGNIINTEQSSIEAYEHLGL